MKFAMKNHKLTMSVLCDSSCLQRAGELTMDTMVLRAVMARLTFRHWGVCCHHERITLSSRWPCQFFTEQVFRFKHPARYADQDSQAKWAASTVELWQVGDRPRGENRVCLAKTLQDVAEKRKAMCHKSTWPNTTTQNFSKTKTVNFYAKLCRYG